MNFFREFENRVAAVFEMAPQGYVEPFSFKKLARKAAHELEAETYEIAGVDTAPALYTILVSSADDSLMRPLYASITEELSLFLAAQADKKGYVLVGTPLVRFMVDPSLKSGKFAVFAENVDGKALARLRGEEQSFLGSSVNLGGAANQVGQSGNLGVLGAAEKAEEPLYVEPLEPLSHSVLAREEDELEPAAVGAAAAGAAAASNADEAEADPLLPLPDSFLVDDRPQAAATIDDEPVASGIDDFEPVVPVSSRVTPVARPIETERAATCTLIERSTGRAHKASAPSAIIGRERTLADIVLDDPNISRKHARLAFDGQNWHIIDLHSTNGTLVNEIDVDECVLRDGDLLTMGLLTLEFRER